MYMYKLCYHSGREVERTSGDIPSLYKLFVLLKFTTWNITLCKW